MRHKRRWRSVSHVCHGDGLTCCMFRKKVMPLMLSDNTVTDEAEAINNLTAFHWVPRHGGSFTRGKTAGS